jgi:LPXTG-site transpeptidase (sortase) family protein
MLKTLLSGLRSIGVLPLVIGLIIGVSVLLLIRAWQVWRYRQSFGYDVYTADVLRRRLVRWAGLAGLIGLLIAGAYAVYRLQPGGKEPAATTGPDTAQVAPEEMLGELTLVIPRLGLELEMIEAPFVARQWDISRLTGEVAHLAGTAYPGQPGNAVLAGHITIPGAGWGPFRELNTLRPGDFIFVERPGETLTYEVIDSKEVPPDAMEVVFPTEDQRLTLITCSGWDEVEEEYAGRIVVVARYVP